MSEITEITRDYVDNFAVKDFIDNNLVDKYFPDIDASLRTVGLIGLTSEIITNYGEDAFNTGSVLFREGFPNRAQIPESIYSHAAIFQLSDVFSTAANCKFLLVLEESAIVKNMVDYYDKDSGIYHFYIDKNTMIYIEDHPFVIDYDIRMNIVKKRGEHGDEYLFTAMYIMDEYSNSISELTNPYIKVRRSSDGFIALEIQCHQCYRDIRYENIIDNNTINFPTIDVDFEGKLAGFEVLYKEPGSSKWIQLIKQVVYSQAIKTPFCYYQLIDNGTIRISFNSKDNFFMPEFNSDLQIILYITEGYDGNFEVYNGTDITLIPNNEKYVYANTYLTAAKPIGSSADGTDEADIDTLQALTVENYRTATALTTENDLQEFFNNYKNRYGDSFIQFIKKRDDVYERVFSAFTIQYYNDYIYKADTLNMKLNIDDFDEIEKGVIYMLQPGYLFTSNEGDRYAYFLRDEEKYNQYYAEYLEAKANGEIPFIEDETVIPGYLDRPASYATFKKRHGLDDRKTVFDLTEEEYAIYDDPTNLKFLYTNPFLLKINKEYNIVTTYLPYINNTTLVDFTGENSDSFVQFVNYILTVERTFQKEKRYHVQLTVTSTISVDESIPFVKYEKDEETGEYHFFDKYTTYENDLRIVMAITDDVKEICFIELHPTAYDPETMAYTFEADFSTDDTITNENRMGIEDGKIYRNKTTGDYYKVHKDDNTLYDLYNSNDEITATDISVDVVTEKYNAGELYIWCEVYNMSSSSYIRVPMSDVVCKIYTLYNRIYSEEQDGLVPVTEEQTNNIFTGYEFIDGEDTFKKRIWTNQYSTATEKVSFIETLSSVRTNINFYDYTKYHTEDGEIVYDNDIMDIVMSSLIYLRASETLNKPRLSNFFSQFLSNYKHLTDIINTRLRNETGVDVKFYNTYGRSRTFIIGEESEPLDTVNLELSFDMWYVSGTDILTATPEVKMFIKKEVESLNGTTYNNLFISNLMRKIEINFPYVDHIRFNSINRYDTDYQAIKATVEDINDLSVEKRRYYVPELLVCDLERIHINEYFTS